MSWGRLAHVPAVCDILRCTWRYVSGIVHGPAHSFDPIADLVSARVAVPHSFQRLTVYSHRTSPLADWVVRCGLVRQVEVPRQWTL